MLSFFFRLLILITLSTSFLFAQAEDTALVQGAQYEARMKWLKELMDNPLEMGKHSKYFVMKEGKPTGLKDEGLEYFYQQALKIEALDNKLNGRFFEMEHLIDTVYRARISSLSAYFQGPPGGAKTSAVKKLLKYTLASTDQYFLQLNQLMTSANIVGPLIQKFLGNGVISYNLNEGLGVAKAALLDEFEKGNPEVYKPLLEVMADREFMLGRLVIPTRTLSIFATSNASYKEFLDHMESYGMGPTAFPLMDRMILKTYVHNWIEDFNKRNVALNGFKTGYMEDVEIRDNLEVQDIALLNHSNQLSASENSEKVPGVLNSSKPDFDIDFAFLGHVGIALLEESPEFFLAKDLLLDKMNVYLNKEMLKTWPSKKREMEMMINPGAAGEVREQAYYPAWGASTRNAFFSSIILRSSMILDIAKVVGHKKDKAILTRFFGGGKKIYMPISTLWRYSHSVMTQVPGVSYWDGATKKVQYAVSQYVNPDTGVYEDDTLVGRIMKYRIRAPLVAELFSDFNSELKQFNKEVGATIEGFSNNTLELAKSLSDLKSKGIVKIQSTSVSGQDLEDYLTKEIDSRLTKRKSSDGSSLYDLMMNTQGSASVAKP